MRKKLEEGNGKQQTLTEKAEPSGNEKRQITRKKKKTKERIEKLEDLKQEVTRTQEKMPMIWEVAFAEVFNAENRSKSGFDLLIGNPPYAVTVFSPANFSRLEPLPSEKSVFSSIRVKT
ncbi:hypothetical protein HRED_03749 [Candidatus Haloredivivus sp. G17]|nr:hypothetical protein HRED_03749 [Candidatus Haloredivivus sp. G17]